MMGIADVLYLRRQFFGGFNYLQVMMVRHRDGFSLKNDILTRLYRGIINTEHFSVSNSCKWPQYANSCDGGREIYPESRLAHFYAAELSKPFSISVTSIRKIPSVHFFFFCLESGKMIFISGENYIYSFITSWDKAEPQLNKKRSVPKFSSSGSAFQRELTLSFRYVSHSALHHFGTKIKRSL